jgi:UrcA family protein
MKRTSTLIAAAALIMSAFAAAPASAATTWGAQSETVSYGDLNLNSEAGAHAMLGRIDHAARTACFDRSGAMPLTARRAINACRTEAMTNAVDTLNAPRVSAMYYGREPAIIIASR